MVDADGAGPHDAAQARREMLEAVGPGRVGFDELELFGTFLLGSEAEVLGEGEDALLPQHRDAALDLGQTLVVAEDDVADLATFGVAGLGVDASDGVGAVHAARDEPFEPELSRRFHVNGEVEVGSPAGLGQQWDVLDDDGVVRLGGGELSGPLADSRMDDRLEFGARVRVVEDDAGESGTVEGTVLVEDVGAEPGDDGGEAVGVRGDDVSGERVRVDDISPQPGELRCDRAFTGSDTTGQCDFEHM